MNLTKSKLLPIFLLGLGIQAHAQQSAVASGGNSAGSSGSASYSVGQVFYTSHSGPNASTSHGVQQAIEVSEDLSMEHFNPKNLQIVVYPNPSTSFVNLEIKDFGSENLSYELYDLNGRSIDAKNVVNNLTKIDLDRLPSTIYFLSIKQEGKQIKNFKLIKKD